MMSDEKDDRIAAAVWPRRELREKEAAARLRARLGKSILQAAIMVAAGLVLFFAAKRPTAGTVLFALAVVVLLCARLAPRAFDRMDRAVHAVERLVGVVLAWVLLVPFFGLVFVPARLIIMLSGKDPLCRRFRSGQTTFWVPHREELSGGYGKQY